MVFALHMSGSQAQQAAQAAEAQRAAQAAQAVQAAQAQGAMRGQVDGYGDGKTMEKPWNMYEYPMFHRQIMHKFDIFRSYCKITRGYIGYDMDDDG